MTTKVISVFNNKGGVGKTTICWNLAESLARIGKNIILVDFDPQCNLSIAVLGNSHLTKVLPHENLPYGKTIRAYLQRFMQNTPKPELFTQNGIHTHKNVNLVVGDFWLNVYAENMSVGHDLLTGARISNYAVITNMLAEANKQNSSPYDYAIIDLPPSFGNLVRVALYCSNYFIVPCTSDDFSEYCVELIGNMLPSFFQDWKVGLGRFNEANPNLDTFNLLGKPKFAGWLFNGFDVRSGNLVQADRTYKIKIRNAIEKKLVGKLKENKEMQATLENYPEDFLLGEVEDMNVLIQNSIWQSCPIPALSSMKQIKDLRNRAHWAPNQLNQIKHLTNSFQKIGENIVKYCV